MSVLPELSPACNPGRPLQMNLVPATLENKNSAPQAAPVGPNSPEKKEAKKPVAKKSAPKKTAASKKSKDGVNKSAEIRAIATAMKARNEKPRPVKIIEMLEKQGIEVSSPQVSQVLKGMGFRPRRRRKNGSAAGVAGPVVKKTGKSGLSVEDLLKAKKMADEFGGARRLVNAISRLIELQ